MQNKERKKITNLLSAFFSSSSLPQHQGSIERTFQKGFLKASLNREKSTILTLLRAPEW